VRKKERKNERQTWDLANAAIVANRAFGFAVGAHPARNAVHTLICAFASARLTVDSTNDCRK
jgi:hypothetical protein